MRKQKSGIAGKIFTGVFLLIVLAFMGLLFNTKLIPTNFLAGIGAILLVIVLVVGMLTWNSHKKIRFALGILLALVFTAVFSVGGLYIHKTTSMLSDISSVNTEIAQVGVYVPTDDKANAVEDTKSYTYGIIADLDRENTDKTVEELKEELGEDIQTKEYAGISELVDGLKQEETDAIILNQAFVPLMEEMEGYSEINSEIKEIDVKHVETVIETKKPASPQKSESKTEIFGAGNNLENNVENNAESNTDSFNDRTDSERADVQESTDVESATSGNVGLETTETASETLETDDETAETDTTDTDTEIAEDGYDNTPASLSDDEGEIYTVFVSGIDNRGGIVAKSRSDVNIIAVANTGTRQLLLVSTPRDFYVPLSISNGVPDKLTHAGIYGINVCMDTLSMLYDIDINYFFRLNFDGFKSIIDALGGITVNSDYDFKTGLFHYDKGENELNGEQALAFARERYAFAEGDRQRGRNQMAVIEGVVNKALSPEILKNYTSVLFSLQESFETNISYEEIAHLVQKQLAEGGDWNIISYSANGTGATKKPYSMSQNAYVMIPDDTTVEKAKELIQKVYDGEVISEEDITGESASDADGSVNTEISEEK